MTTGKVVSRSKQSLGVSEASGLAAFDDGTFLVVDDEQGIFHYVPGGGPVNLGAGEGLSDLEGVSVTPDGRYACILCESDGSVWRFSIRGHDLTEGRQLGRLPRLSKEKNKGWEGIFVVDAGVLAAEAVILAVHQAKPRRIGMFDAETLQQRSLLRLPKTVRKNIGDLNDVAVAPGGRILLLSGRCGRIAELDLETGSLVLQAIYQIETATGDVPEGITVDAEGRIWICTDGKGLLHQVELVQ